MAHISRTDLSSWTTQGAQDAAALTYKSVQAALANLSPKPEIFLQGSYANSTNTRGDSDVDIVVMTKQIYIPDVDRLSSQEQRRYEAQSTPATMTSSTFRATVERALIDYYGSHIVHPKNKCIRVDKRPGYVDADVVPALQHKLFTSYPSYGEPTFIEGIALNPLTGPSIVNYPKEHRKNGEAKNRRCAEHYKPAVRQTKRVRRRAVDLGLLDKKAAPGYLLECMVYNVPDHRFNIADDASRVIAVLEWLNDQSGEDMASTFMSCDGVHHLFKDDPGGHDADHARHIIDVLWGLL